MPSKTRNRKTLFTKTVYMIPISLPLLSISKIYNLNSKINPLINYHFPVTLKLTKPI